jgi:antitoxin PrlF
MHPAPPVESTLTDRFQTTVPQSVRQALRLGKRDKIHYTIRPNGEVVLTRAAPRENDDPALAPFLDFLARDLVAHPERLQALDPGLAYRILALVGEVEVALDAPLPADDE